MKQFGFISERGLARAMVLLGAGRACAEPPLFGVIERVGNQFTVLPELDSSQVLDAPFFLNPQGVERRWKFDWGNLEPAFNTYRFECRNPNRAISCLRSAKRSLPACDEYADGETNFVKLSLTKSDYGDTPRERLTKSPLGLGGIAMGAFAGIFIVPVAVVALPIIGVGRAVSNPECVGWDTKWVEFDHDAFSKELKQSLERVNWGASEQRRSVEEPYRRFLAEVSQLDDRQYQESEQTLLDVSQQIKPLEALLSQMKVKSNFVLPKVKRWQQPKEFAQVHDSYAEPFGRASSQINSYYAGERERLAKEAEKRLAALKEQSISASQASFDRAHRSSDWRQLVSALEATADPGGILIASKEQLTVALKAEDDERAAEQRRIAQWTVKQDEERRKFALEVARFRKGLKVGQQSNCGPIIELKADLVKVAMPIPEYGTEHWVRSGILYPAGHPCPWRNGVIESPY